MPDASGDDATLRLLERLTAEVADARAAATRDPFGNPVLSVALTVSRLIDDGALDNDGLRGLVNRIADAAFTDRAARLAAYVGASDPRGFARIAARVARPDPKDSPVPFAAFRAAVEIPRYAAVFTAHPTFSMPEAAAALLARMAHEPTAELPAAYRPVPVTLDDEFNQAMAAIARARDGIDAFVHALLTEAERTWPDRWAGLDPAPVVVASWVGTDTDGRTDIGWADMLHFRLRLKLLALERLARALPAGRLADRVAAAQAAVSAQLAACPRGISPSPELAEKFAHILLGQRDAALVDAAELHPLFDEAVAGAPDDSTRKTIVVARAGLSAHGLALAMPHVRLNAAQVHNAIRASLGAALGSATPGDRAARRGLLAALNAALDKVGPVPIDFGSLLAEQASAAKLMMTCAQILKHIDAGGKIRFLIAETESGFTLLAALWLARRFGIDAKLEISPLFETADGLEHGNRVLEEALRSPHYRAYLRANGRLCLQFGYSDSGRFVGPLPASYLIEKLRARIVEALNRHGLSNVEIVLFNTHGESIGRGAHPGSLADRLEYLAPAQSRAGLAAGGFAVREESSFQGTDGYLLFGSKTLAEATVARIAEHAFAPPDTKDDPVYAEADWAAEFFAGTRVEMEALVEDPGYAAFLGAFGPALLDKSGSRPAARQKDGMGSATSIAHPRELRAIPNNAILQQLGYLANTLHGLGRAASRAPETFAEMLASSPRFARALGMAAGARAVSDLDVLRAYVASLDPGVWLDRAGRTQRPGRREELTAVAAALEEAGLSARARKMFRRLQADALALGAVWPAPAASDRLVLLHALRLAAVHRIWLLAARIPDFSPRHGVTRAALVQRLLHLDVPWAIEMLGDVFPAAPDPAAQRDFAEPPGVRAENTYAAEHVMLFGPMLAWFAATREVSAAVTHEVGAFG
jgi:phosphoenolpyruvate carboxylase